jgi:hypothetical protein
MKKCYIFIMAALILLNIPSEALGQKIAFAAMSPSSPAAGTISGQGTFEIGAKHLTERIVLFAVNPSGGKGGQVSCEYDDKTWNGQIANLGAATYKVFARLTYRIIGSTTEYHVDTPMVDRVVK